MTTKTLKDLFEVYKPKSPDEQKFVDKHVTIKHKDRNGNDDDVFKGNTKYIKRKEERKGYDVGEDEKVYEEVEEIDELSRATLGRYAKKAQGEAEDKFDNTHRYAGRWMAGKKRWGGTGGISAARVPATNEEVELEEGMMKLSKVHIVHHHDHPAAKEFAKNYTAGMKGDHRESGPNEADEKASNAFHQRYTGVRTREGFAGSGTHVYTDHKTGAKWKVDRHPNGKTFYGTDHIISHVTGSIHEDFNLEEGEVLDTIAEDRVLRSLVAYYEELGEEVLIDDIMNIAEEIIEDLNEKLTSKTPMGTYIKDFQKSDAPQFKGKSQEKRREMAIAAKLANEEVEDLEELSKSTLASYAGRAMNDVRNSNQAKIRWQNKPNDKFQGQDPKGNYVTKSSKEMEDEHGRVAKNREKGVRTAIKKLAKEEVDQIDEISANLASRYLAKASSTRANDSAHKNLPMNKRDNRMAGSNLAREKIRAGQNKDSGARVGTNEEVQIDELSKKTLGSYSYKAATDLGQRGITAGVKVADNKPTKDDFKKMGNRQKGVAMAVKKLTKEDVINITLEKISPVLEDVEPLTPEERLVSKLDGISESHIHLLLSLFESLNEDNQTKMLSTVETEEGIRGLIDFAIDNRGE